MLVSLTVDASELPEPELDPESALDTESESDIWCSSVNIGTTRMCYEFDEVGVKTVIFDIVIVDMYTI